MTNTLVGSFSTNHRPGTLGWRHRCCRRGGFSRKPAEGLSPRQKLRCSYMAKE